jgi:GSH-dependent disulfide-bond oxidoreductase
MYMLDNFDITRRWAAKDPSAIQLYSFPTPNGIKISAMLEETGLAYEPHLVKFSDNDQFTPEFLSLNPNNKIPAILDPNGPGGKPLPLFESGAILIYLAEKSGQFLPEDAAMRYQTIQWLMWQMGGAGPMFGQFGHFHATEAGKAVADKYAWNRYKEEAERLLDVLDERLEGRDYVMGEDYTIADIAIWPWVRALRSSYKAADVLDLDELKNVARWLELCASRPASLKAINIPDRFDVFHERQQPTAGNHLGTVDASLSDRVTLKPVTPDWHVAAMAPHAGAPVDHHHGLQEREFPVVARRECGQIRHRDGEKPRQRPVAMPGLAVATGARQPVLGFARTLLCHRRQGGGCEDNCTECHEPFHHLRLPPF